ncbi:3',5'-cyclic-nucleotide phosphodiesterase [Methylobacterium sp. J-068]|uniref:3',5'-cyclic-nucleotide phosphodiesterase n=1 Tax=Methylobacterium sp. J-068 TaxID=2836649 RepID=UPI001FBA129C|nr:3',5'-cyclic-nucleotide phosphodiesterase [Methylobacterium sp. J-068]MCJ2035557.1 3',5'-cyclic-nucleotide phosphodiesterase [Methylobacterium sp. J-068]
MIRSRILVLTALVALPPAAARARDLGASVETLRLACTGDYRRLCAGIDPNADHVEACFRARIAQVSDGCRSAIARYGMQESSEEGWSQQAESRRPR